MTLNTYIFGAHSRGRTTAAYLKEINDSLMVDSMFQNIVDHHLSNLNLIISGSSIKTMKDLLIEGNPLFGRFDLTIKLPEFNYFEASQFYPNLTNYDKVAMYSVFGGSPFVNKVETKY